MQRQVWTIWGSQAHSADLENWWADPEEWLSIEDKENDQWEFEIRVRQAI